MRQIPVDMAGSDTEDGCSTRVLVVAEPSADLLDRALVGWEHFLSTFEGGVGE
ncbi:hypothetical protein [Streptomyces sp. NPDC002082]|uniref:hypothetical protein n=1 Tax=Streptomyces sp. NPDC002082 TaxID=3154772 RepID=UPI00331C62F7